jgi:hypothetical protein
MKTITLRALTWPLYVGTLITLVIHAMWGTNKWFEKGVLFTRLKAESWPSRTWYRAWAGTTFGYGVMISATASESVIDHELIHVEQYQAASIGGLALGLLVLAITHSVWGIAAFFALWMLTHWAVYFAATFTAWLRREPNAYRGNCWEEAAYAETEVKCRTPQV